MFFNKHNDRVIELNEVILEKKQHNIDLQELNYNQNKVAESRKLAVHIVNQQLKVY